MKQTEEQFTDAINQCREVFISKLKDYGPAWRILRPVSITDQLYIKASRIRSFEIKKVQKINENSLGEYIALVNYAIIGLIQLDLGFIDMVDISYEKAEELYNKYAEKAKALMLKKNHDYNEAWRKMRISSYTDLILMKIFRIKQIEDHQGDTIASEGVDANYMDIANYAVFAIIKISEMSQK